ncbi:nitrite reductase small subunit NirD [Ideonella livida]|uniref:Nitrite reductase small subunit NirD n=1 Tax=Ideonella livida TaxID=2707176 RepID=A0A7C9TH95_9BURK|nr:nitrite reductase small subunit NirD [Ideonella livida]NDY90401.1 nitrite reductase small subunit NirD [Ideonella livida]
MTDTLTPTAPSAHKHDTSAWTSVCAADAILPNTGVCARVGLHHVAIFRLAGDRFFALDNVDPKSGASVLSRGLVGSLGERLVVASPLYKQHYDLVTGECLEDAALSIQAWTVRVLDGQVQVAATAATMA